MLAGEILHHGGNESLRAKWLPEVAKGDKVISLGYQEVISRYNIHQIAMRAAPQVRDGRRGWALSGEKIQVLDGHISDALVLTAHATGADARTGGIGLFLVEKGSPGLSVERQIRVDHRNAAIVRLDEVFVAQDDVISGPSEGSDVLARVIDRATIGLSAEMLGTATAAFERTVAYLKERQQFGVSIGSFQALQHRAARMFIELTLARTAVTAAAIAADQAPQSAAEMASLAKARCSEVLVHVANEGVQMYGGVGMTDEYDIGLYLKRARACDATFGDAAFHRDRWARLKGY
jgi:acyl-CoA dehydrogenase